MRVLELSNDFFGKMLLYGHIDTYSGDLNPDYFDNRDWDEDEDSEFDYEEFLSDVNDEIDYWFADTVFERYFKPLGFAEIRNSELQRPKYYNYTGDKVTFQLLYDPAKFGGLFFTSFEDWAISILEGVGGKFRSDMEAFLAEEFSSQPGFVSWTPNNIKDLKKALADDHNIFHAINAFVAAFLHAKIAAGEIEILTPNDFNEIVERMNNRYY